MRAISWPWPGTILEALPRLSSQLSSLKSDLFLALDLPKIFSALSDLLDARLAGSAEPPLPAKKAGLIKPGYHEELDLIKRGLT